MPDRPYCVGSVGFVVGDTEDRGRKRSSIIADRYVRDGEDFTRALLGQFAAVIIDVTARRVVLAQDSLGLRTLYYSVLGSRLVVSSSLLGVMSKTGLEDVDDLYFANYLAFSLRPLSATPIKGISRLSGGATLVLGDGWERRLRPWSPSDQIEANNVDDAANRLRSLLDEAVAASLYDADQPLCDLSGGLDSSSVFATAHTLAPATQAFTLVSGSGSYDAEDEARAREMAQQSNAVWQTLDMDRHPMFSQIPRDLTGEPGGEAHLAIQAAYRGTLERSAGDVILTGVGGDVVFGYGGLPPLDISDAFARGGPARMVEASRVWARAAGGSRPWTHFFMHSAVPVTLTHLAHRSLVLREAGSQPQWLAKAFMARAGGASMGEASGVPRLRGAGRQYLWESVYRMANDEASSAFRGSLPVPTRHPLLHRPLVEFMLARPAALRASPAQDRILQRRALDDRLPNSIRARTTKGSDQRIRDRLQGRSPQWMAMMADTPRIVERGWVDGDLWRAQLQRARFGLVDGLGNFSAAMSAEAWLRTLENHRR